MLATLRRLFPLASDGKYIRTTNPITITLFTRKNCGLCEKAASILGDLWSQRPFEAREIDIMQDNPESKKWRDVYEFDVPVIHIERTKTVQKGDQALQEGALTNEIKMRKLMHHFRKSEVIAAMNEVAGKDATKEEEKGSDQKNQPGLHIHRVSSGRLRVMRIISRES
ncbi:hypothetical protein BDZ91DRAFT_710076 [Kalaharituber pfeilii]|nr:hypothetical protein BDZ91DRAFT_710076 [Kalaharituber pfeilii]